MKETVKTAENIKQRIILALKWIGIVAVCAALVEALRIFMWMCYYAEIPM